MRWLIAVLLLVGSACKGSDAGQAAPAERVPLTPLDSYRTRLVDLGKLETSALTAVADHTGSRYKDDPTLLAALQQHTLPRYQEFVTGLAALAPPPEAKAVHDKLITLARAELVVLEKMTAAVERGDGTALLLMNREQQRLAAEMQAVLGEWRVVAGAKK